MAVIGLGKRSVRGDNWLSHIFIFFEVVPISLFYFICLFINLLICLLIFIIFIFIFLFFYSVINSFYLFIIIFVSLLGVLTIEAEVISILQIYYPAQCHPPLLVINVPPRLRNCSSVVMQEPTRHIAIHTDGIRMMPRRLMEDTSAFCIRDSSSSFGASRKCLQEPYSGFLGQAAGVAGGGRGAEPAGRSGRFVTSLILFFTFFPLSLLPSLLFSLL